MYEVRCNLLPLFEMLCGLQNMHLAMEELREDPRVVFLTRRVEEGTTHRCGRNSSPLKTMRVVLAILES